jgi:hypothetical protein
MRLHGVWTFYIVDPNSHPIETYETLPDDVKKCENLSATFNNGKKNEEAENKE